MKKILRVLVVLAALALVMIVTVPSPENHRNMLREKLENMVMESDSNGFERWVSKKIVKWELKDLKIQDCLLFNLGYFDSDSREYISVGAFNHVFLLVRP